MGLLKTLALATATVIVAASNGRADTIFIGDGSGKPVKSDGVKITGLQGDELHYTTPEGMQTRQPMSHLVQISVDGETAFNSAEQAFATGDMDAAVTNYQSVVQSSTSKDWMLSRAGVRLVAAGKLKNRYDAQVMGYCALVQKDPPAAGINRPGVPEEHSPYLDAALTTVTRALGDAQLNSTQKSSLLSIELSIDRAKGDKAGATAVLQQMTALGGSTAADRAMLRLAQADVDMDSRQYAQAITGIEQNKAIFTDPQQQVEALYILAEAHMAIDGDKSDPDKLKDLALNYMRVAAFGSGKLLPDRPHVAESLLQAAKIEEKLNDKNAAISLYQKLVNDKAYAGTAAAAKAQAALTQLNAK